MQLTDRRIGNAVVLATAGRIDHASAEGFKAALQPVVKENFEISKFTLVVPCFDGVRDALAKLAPSALGSYEAG